MVLYYLMDNNLDNFSKEEELQNGIKNLEKAKCNFYELKCKNYTLEEQSIINILKRNSSITQKNIANEINKSLRTVKTYMIEMQKKGLIEGKNSKKKGNTL